MNGTNVEKVYRRYLKLGADRDRALLLKWFKVDAVKTLKSGATSPVV